VNRASDRLGEAGFLERQIGGQCVRAPNRRSNIAKTVERTGFAPLIVRTLATVVSESACAPQISAVALNNPAKSSTPRLPGAVVHSSAARPDTSSTPINNTPPHVWLSAMARYLSTPRVNA